MVNKYDIVRKIENFAPPETAQEWDCVGFMAETQKTDVSKIMLCLTPTDDVISQALNQNCDMIVSHHPMFEISLNSALLNGNGSPKIDIYSAHTNLDISNGGTTDTLIKALNWDNFEFVKSDNDFIRYIEFKTPIEVGEFDGILRKISPNLRYINNFGIKAVKKVGFCAGSGSEFINEAIENGADCFVTGDLKFHTAVDSQIVVFDIGHFESEILIVPVLKGIIGDGADIIFADEKSPFIY